MRHAAMGHRATDKYMEDWEAAYASMGGQGPSEVAAGELGSGALAGWRFARHACPFRALLCRVAGSGFPREVSGRSPAQLPL